MPSAIFQPPKQHGEDARLNLHDRLPPGSAKAYAFATLCIGVASALRWGLGFLSEEVSPFATYYPAVLFAALIGGFGPGIFAAALGGVIGWWAFMSPQFTFYPFSAGQRIALLTYSFASVLIVWGGDYFRRVAKRLQDEEKFRKLAVEELTHRLKNKIATIEAIISFQLRENPDFRDNILRRLHALSATDELIESAQGTGAHIREILSTELRPYGASRMSMEGPNILLAPKLALTMALLFHELATNAAKYGALSVPTGQLFIRWSLSEARLNLEWSESGGPNVALPTRCGFGMRLLSRALDQFSGTVDTSFVSTGLICKMSLTLP